MKRKEEPKLADEGIPYKMARIEIGVENFDWLIGQIFTHSELLGLQDRQLSAYKSSLRKMCWEWYNRFVDNPQGLADPSHQARLEAGIESATTTGISSYVSYTG